MGWAGCAQAVSQLLGQGKTGERKHKKKNKKKATGVVQYSPCMGTSLCVKPGGNGVHE